MLGFVTGPFKDIGKAFSYGFDLPHNVKTEGVKGLAKGFHPYIGGAIVGGAVGGLVGAKVEETDPLVTAAGGAVIGSAALPALGLIGAGAYGVGAGILNNSDKILRGVGNAGKWVGRATLRGIAGPGFNEATKLGYWGNKILNPVARHLTAIDGMSKHFVKYTPKREVYKPRKIFKNKPGKMVTKSGFKLGWLGWMTLGAGAVMGGTRQAAQTADSIRMGQRDPYITRATPRVPSYANNAGATGDLVFALNANRRG